MRTADGSGNRKTSWSCEGECCGFDDGRDLSYNGYNIKYWNEGVEKLWLM